MKSELLQELNETVTNELSRLKRLRVKKSLTTDETKDAVLMLGVLKDKTKAVFVAREETLSQDALALKKEFHGAAGHALIATRLFAEQDANVGLNDVWAAWDALISLFETGEHSAPVPDAAKQLQQAADAAGIILTIQSAIPQDEEALRTFMKEASAALLAAVKEGRKSVTV